MVIDLSNLNLYGPEPGWRFRVTPCTLTTTIASSPIAHETRYRWIIEGVTEADAAELGLEFPKLIAHFEEFGGHVKPHNGDYWVVAHRHYSTPALAALDFILINYRCAFSATMDRLARRLHRRVASEMESAVEALKKDGVLSLRQKNWLTREIQSLQEHNFQPMFNYGLGVAFLPPDEGQRVFDQAHGNRNPSLAALDEEISRLEEALEECADPEMERRLEEAEDLMALLTFMNVEDWCEEGPWDVPTLLEGRMKKAMEAEVG